MRSDFDGRPQSRDESAPRGRVPASDKPDVYLHVPEVHVGEIYLDVENLDVQLSLKAKLANLVEVSAGVQVHADKIELDIKDVEARAVLKVRLENLRDILDRALTTIDRHPEILQSLLSTTAMAVDGVEQTARQAVEPGGAVAESARGLGQGLQETAKAVGGDHAPADPEGRPRGS